jgi:hypothetical protein
MFKLYLECATCWTYPVWVLRIPLEFLVGEYMYSPNISKWRRQLWIASTLTNQIPWRWSNHVEPHPAKLWPSSKAVNPFKDMGDLYVAWQLKLRVRLIFLGRRGCEMSRNLTRQESRWLDQEESKEYIVNHLESLPWLRHSLQLMSCIWRS